MATTNAKPKAARKAPAKKAAIKKNAPAVIAQEPDVVHETAPEPPPAETEPALTKADVAEMIANAVGQAIPEAVNQAVTAITSDQQKRLDELNAEHARDPNMMTSYPEEDIELLELADPIAAQVAKRGPGGKVVEAPVFDTPTLTKEQVENMSEEEIAAYNQNELRRVEARKQQQEINRSKLEKMSPKDRMQNMFRDRDPSVIREADNPLGERMIDCVAKRRVGLGEQGTSEIDERIRVPISGARHLQESGAIIVSI